MIHTSMIPCSHVVFKDTHTIETVEISPLEISVDYSNGFFEIDQNERGIALTATQAASLVSMLNAELFRINSRNKIRNAS